VVSKALVALGVLGQGEEGVHEAIRDLIIRRGAPKAIADALRGLGTLSEDVRSGVAKIRIFVSATTGVQGAQLVTRGSRLPCWVPMHTTIRIVHSRCTLQQMRSSRC